MLVKKVFCKTERSRTYRLSVDCDRTTKAVLESIKYRGTDGNLSLRSELKGSEMPSRPILEVDARKCEYLSLEAAGAAQEFQASKGLGSVRLRSALPARSR